MLPLAEFAANAIKSEATEFSPFYLNVKELGEVMRLAFLKARSRICTRRKTKRKEEGIRNQTG